MVSIGIYISVPFCRSKCTYCNFASGVFSQGQMAEYVARLCSDIAVCRDTAAQRAAAVPHQADSVYLGGGTPTLLPAEQLQRLFSTLRAQFEIAPPAEITVECAPGTLSEPVLQALVGCGVNRVSLGVQSFVDRESASVARLHTRQTVLADIERLRQAGITNINVDLIAGLPHQTPDSWQYSLDQVIAAKVPHVSVYMLEVDEDSRLGRELIAGGSRYHAHSAPNDDATADFYETACEHLNGQGITQYEISNFARSGSESRHNLKYWTRRPYFGFGVDAHSMLPAAPHVHLRGVESVRLATTDSLDEFLKDSHIQGDMVASRQALEEYFFLGLRLNRGIDQKDLRQQFGNRIEDYRPSIEELVAEGMLTESAHVLRLTPRGRLLSNEVFQRFISPKEPAVHIPA